MLSFFTSVFLTFSIHFSMLNVSTVCLATVLQYITSGVQNGGTPPYHVKTITVDNLTRVDLTLLEFNYAISFGNYIPIGVVLVLPKNGILHVNSDIDCSEPTSPNASHETESIAYYLKTILIPICVIVLVWIALMIYIYRHRNSEKQVYANKTPTISNNMNLLMGHVDSYQLKHNPESDDYCEIDLNESSETIYESPLDILQMKSFADVDKELPLYDKATPAYELPVIYDAGYATIGQHTELVECNEPNDRAIPNPAYTPQSEED